MMRVGTLMCGGMVLALGAAMAPCGAADPLDSLPSAADANLRQRRARSASHENPPPVRVRVKRPVSAAQIDPSGWTQEAGPVDSKGMEGTHAEPVQRVAAPRKWNADDLDELPPPAWEEEHCPTPHRQAMWEPHGRVNAGLIHRSFGRTEFTARSYSSVEHLPPPELGLLGAAGEFGFADREYFDGFVRVGSGTAASGLTTFWGYENNAQYNPAGAGGNGTLTYDGAGYRLDRTGVTSSDVSKSWGEDMDGMGPHVGYDLLLPLTEHWRVGQQSDLSFVKVGASRHVSNFRANIQEDVYDVPFTDTFDLGGVVPPLAPYEGTYFGPGPQIPNEPASRVYGLETLTGSIQQDVWNDVYQELNVDLYTISFGALMEFALGPFFAQGSGGLAMNIADYDATHCEQLFIDDHTGDTQVLRKWYKDDQGTKVLWGVYVQGALGLQMSERWSLSGFARYDWNDDLDAGVGPSEFRMELSAFSAGGQFGFSF